MNMLNFLRRKKDNVQLFYHTDMHNHILPGVDHGSQSVEQSLQMLEAEIKMGIKRVICTPHVTAETFENTPDTILPAFEVLKNAVAEAGLDVELHVSAEYRLDDFWNKQYAAGNLIPMPGKFLLVENSFMQELLELDELLFDLAIKGYQPILAHPERYGYYSHRHHRYETMHNAGVCFQLNILSLAGYFGSSARDNAVWLVKNGMVDMLGTDMHNLEHAEIIMEYLRSKDWRKMSALLEPHIMNDDIA